MLVSRTGGLTKEEKQEIAEMFTRLELNPDNGQITIHFSGGQVQKIERKAVFK